MNRSPRLITLTILVATVVGAVLSARSDAWFHGALAAVLTGITAAAAWRRTSTSRTFWGIAAVVLALGGAATFLGSLWTEQRCTARYQGQRVVIGTQLTREADTLVKSGPQSTNDSLLFDAAGDPGLVWTDGSIRRCGQWLLVLGSLWVPLLGMSLLCAASLAGSRWRPGAPALPATPAAPGEPLYDAFISYRHATDSDFARNLVQELEQAGYRVAIDERDFRPEQSFLSEMERCIRESRFTLALVSKGFMDSGNTEEEAIITKVLDMGERKRRLVPLILQRVERPAWMYGIVGVDLTAEDGLVEPLEKLKAALGKPLSKTREGQ
jgi:TIR domain